MTITRAAASAVLACVLAGWPAASALAARSGESTRVTVDGGTVQGLIQGTIVAFKGIPFAAPPLGPLRWRPPQAIVPWHGARQANAYGPDCLQVPFPGDAAPLGVQSKEDCLYVNVWAPLTPNRRLPVMVWIYGGGFVNGGSSPPEYDGSRFARDGIVLVSFNYRLGNFGFFAHPALVAEQPDGPLGNYALMDQLAALKWVRRNVGAFGGDPGNVTIFGESAGGVSVHALLSSPQARGLFQKAIIESGGGRPGLLRARPLSDGSDSATAMGLALASSFAIQGDGPAALEQLRALAADRVLDGLNMATMRRSTTYVGGPILDGQLFLGAPSLLYAAGAGARVPVMIGANSADIGRVTARSLDELFARFGAQADSARRLYDPEHTGDLRAILARVGGDQAMVEPARHIARILSARGQPVYEFRFSYVAESLRSTLPGALHATEIPYVFDTVGARYGKALTGADEQAAQAMHRYWVAFARNGKPEVPGQTPWPAYDARADVIMDFTTAGPQAGADPWRARLDLMEALSNRSEQTAEPH
jgi:para-nitrobenzyl esterase